jgi:hypothetical protein
LHLLGSAFWDAQAIYLLSRNDDSISHHRIAVPLQQWLTSSMHEAAIRQSLALRMVTLAQRQRA